ncbi:isoaspartyl peptidase/L-asparaginase family protein [Blastopirellula retiformator]|uniref:Isoaspartyl peptidase n=1 Tax=Blastopirellula retiformator TaxID=2527970 RepID=A0A5C5V4B9_9BACT|nr:isoaspartyl peptidase/L-asparaginase [Blastopirellula retiformator]TWT32582.1 Isoaspartyl peptidase precursor [Blastopirellula retiformator]
MVGMLTATASAEESRWAIALHGGAGFASPDMAPEKVEQFRVALEKALAAGEKVLQSGGTAVDAVQQTVMVLEDAPYFNAGRGAVFNAEAFHQLDASIMDGGNLDGGGVSAVKHVRNPIRAARLVMEKTPHVLLTADDADQFAKTNGLEMVEQGYFYDASSWAEFQQWSEKKNGVAPKAPSYPLNESAAVAEPTDTNFTCGTVGCVALDKHGNLAAATSTGGMTGKLPGRVGDSPILSAGTYADNAGCAVSGTGVGEQYIRHAIAFQTNWRVKENQQPVADAVQDCLDKVLNPGDGGIIAIDHDGNMALQYNSGSMSRGWSDWRGNRGVAIWKEPLEK